MSLFHRLPANPSLFKVDALIWRFASLAGGRSFRPEFALASNAAASLLWRVDSLVLENCREHR